MVDDQGYAVGHGIARPGRGRRHQSQPPGMTDYALPALINITVSEARLGQLKAQPAEPRSGAPPGDWEFVPRTADTWTLTLPGGQALAVRFDVVPTHSCDHTYEVSTYQPSERLRRLIRVRDRECTFPPCSHLLMRAISNMRSLTTRAGGRTRATPEPAAGDAIRSNNRPAGNSRSPSRAGTCGRPRPAGPTFRSRGATPHDRLAHCHAQHVIDDKFRAVSSRRKAWRECS